MTDITISLFWQFMGWLIEKLGLDKPKSPNKELINFLKSKGFHFKKLEVFES